MLHAIINRFESLVEYCGRAVSWLTLFMVIVTFTVVVLRYTFDIGWIALQESITYMHAMVFLVGSAYTLHQDEHVRVDIFYQNMGRRGKAWVDLLGSIFLLLPVMVFIAWVSWEYVTNSWDVLEGSREAGGLPGVYLLKSFILVMAALLVLQGIAITLRSLSILLTDKTSK